MFNQIKESEKVRGIVKFFLASKRYGFVTSEEGKDYFIHQSDTYKGIRKNDAVEFEVAQIEKGTKAIKVKKVSE